MSYFIYPLHFLCRYSRLPEATGPQSPTLPHDDSVLGHEWLAKSASVAILQCELGLRTKATCLEYRQRRQRLNWEVQISLLSNSEKLPLWCKTRQKHRHFPLNLSSYPPGAATH